ncbi:hypothetical protein [Enterococcus sp. DIV1420a]|uniref:hypothetical protein n=1 Tax=Enterococcus sp. DIV1420a TaxID=2774672 RepID=UPI003F293147
MSILIKDKFEAWQKEAQDRFDQLKANEEELNKIFIELYGLQDELDYHVDDKEVSVSLADRERDIKSLISYAVGCMFGRYSLDEEGLIFAGGEFDMSRYHKFLPNEKNCLYITDDLYDIDDDQDIVNKFIEFITVVYGKETLEENLDYIADVLPASGKSRDKIRKYFVDGFYKDHLKTYKKRPIYWQFDSGKENSLKALMYLHRYQPENLMYLQTDIISKLEGFYFRRSELRMNQKELSTVKKDQKKYKEELQKLSKQLKELSEFKKRLFPLTAMDIQLNLDDGVVVNYEKLQTDYLGRNMKILARR